MGVDQQGALRDDFFSRTQAVEHFEHAVARTAEAHRPGCVGAGGAFDVNGVARACAQHGTAGYGQRLGRVELHAAFGIDAMRQFAPCVGSRRRIGQLHTHAGETVGCVEIRVDEADRRGERFAWGGLGGDGHRLSDAQPRKVLFVGFELEPHRGEVGDLEEPGAELDLLALVHVARDDRAVVGRDQRGERFGLASGDEGVDGFFIEAGLY